MSVRQSRAAARSAVARITSSLREECNDSGDGEGSQSSESDSLDEWRPDGGAQGGEEGGGGSADDGSEESDGSTEEDEPEPIERRDRKREAETHVARTLGVSKKVVKLLVRNLSAAYAHMSSDRVCVTVRATWDAMVKGPEYEGVDTATAAKLMRWAVDLASGLRIPDCFVASAFAPLQEVNGGRLARFSHRMVHMFAFSIFLVLAREVVSSKRHGTPQRRLFESLLAGLGLGDAASLLAEDELKDEKECALAYGRRAVERINLLPEEERVRCLVRQIAAVPFRLPRPAGLGGGGSMYCTELHDGPRTLQEHVHAFESQHTLVVVEVVTVKGGLFDRAIRQTFGEKYAVETSRYPSLPALHFPSGTPPGLYDAVVPLRAKRPVIVGDDSDVPRVVRQLLAEEPRLGALMRAVDETVEGDHPDRLRVPPGVLLASDAFAAGRYGDPRRSFHRPGQTASGQRVPYGAVDASRACPADQVLRFLVPPRVLGGGQLRLFVFDPELAFESTPGECGRVGRTYAKKYRQPDAPHPRYSRTLMVRPQTEVAYEAAEYPPWHPLSRTGQLFDRFDALTSEMKSAIRKSTHRTEDESEMLRGYKQARKARAKRKRDTEADRAGEEARELARGAD